MMQILSFMNGYRKITALLPAAGFVALMSLSVPAHAQCEDPMSATQEMYGLMQDDIDRLNEFIRQEWNFIDRKLSNTASTEITTRYEQFERNILNAISNLWNNNYLPAMRQQTAQLHSMQIEQSMQMGAMIDAHSMTEAQADMNRKEIEAKRRYAPASQTCQVDSVGRSQTRSYRMARAVTRGLAKSQEARALNTVGTPAASGRAADVRALWDNYAARYCDPAKGDQGCSAPGIMPGRHADLPALLWGETQTIDVSTPDNRDLVDTAVRFVVDPLAQNQIQPGALSSAEGQRALLERRSRQTRLNTVYNALGQMLAERVGGSGATTQAMMLAAGKSNATASADPSYREIQEALTRARYYNPEYIVRVVDAPAAVVREQGAVNAIRLQQLNDLYHRQEEMLAMEAAYFAQKLDARVPRNPVEAAPNR